jgi:hypothetical protein
MKDFSRLCKLPERTAHGVTKICINRMRCPMVLMRHASCATLSARGTRCALYASKRSSIVGYLVESKQIKKQKQTNKQTNKQKKKGNGEWECLE